MLRYFASALACALLVAVPSSTHSSKPANASQSDQVAAPASADPPVSHPDRTPALVAEQEATRGQSSISKLIGTAGSSFEAKIAREPDARIDAASEQMQPSQPPTREAICQVLHEAAKENDLPVPLFARLIWQESRFRPRAVSPVGARGIAQFMPATAAERGLEDPFNPIEALPASAQFLRDLVEQFGNFGLAAAAYNGGPGRVSRWLQGRGGLPKETRDYVIHITGRTAEHWAKGGEHAKPHPEATDVSDCNVAPLHAALADIRNEARIRTVERAAEERGKAIARVQATWIALLTGNWTQQRVQMVYAKLQKKYPKDLGTRKPVVRMAQIKSKKKSKTPTVQVRLAAETREEAEKLCKRLQEAGGACAVKKDPT
ncbi:MAG: transglycosylase SLT domain-containing protein [Bradyrhizobiaceae bacterium]|nr:transglycosylase SLT domain-containing protein [Bradyrhizobiaceae bacterium]